jgi:thiamine transporter
MNGLRFLFGRMYMENRKTRILVECAVLVALASVLSLPFLPKLPYGGSITLCGMLPIMAAGYRNGIRWGLLSGFVFGLLHLFAFGGLGDLKGVSVDAFIGSLILDFIVAFSVLGLAGIFRNKISNQRAAFTIGAATVLMLRYLAHIVSGIILFGAYAQWFFTDGAGASYGAGILANYSDMRLIVVYSVIYNGLYMIPEIILETIAALLVAKVVTRKTV